MLASGHKRSRATTSAVSSATEGGRGVGRQYTFMVELGLAFTQEYVLDA